MVASKIGFDSGAKHYIIKHYSLENKIKTWKT